MRIKKGFTLAEILIVLMVIGVIATMTVPSLMKGVNEATYKTAYKKAYNAITNIAAVEKIAGALPTTGSAEDLYNLFASLNSNLSVKEYQTAPTSAQINTAGGVQGVLSSGSVTYNAVTLNGIVYGNTGATNNLAGGAPFTGVDTFSPWIITDDGLAYSIMKSRAADTACSTKMIINDQTTLADVKSNSCAIIVVDVNGLAKGPNMVEPQVLGTTFNNEGGTLAAETKMNTLTGDRYFIYLGLDGTAAGPKAITVSGRLMGDLK